MSQSEKNVAQTVADLARQNEMSMSNNLAPSLVSVPEGYRLQDTEEYQGHRNRFRGLFSTESSKAFSDYVVNRGNADKCFVDNTNPRAMECRAIFNLGDYDLPGHADDVARLTLPATDEFKALTGLGRTSQSDLVDFIQDYAHCLSFDFEEDFEAAEHYAPISLAYALRAFRTVTVKTANQVTRSVGDLSSSKSALEQIEAESIVRLPRLIKMKTSLYNDLPETVVTARVAVITDGDSLAFSLKIVQKQKELNDAADRFVELVNSILPDKTPVFVGTFTP